MEIFCPEKVDEIQRPPYDGQKTMVIMFFNRDRMHMIKILPQNERLNAEYFAEIILSSSLVSICYPNGRRSRGRKCVVHFDNAPMHNSKKITDKLMKEDLKKMSHPAYNPNRSPCDFFLFSYLRNKLIDEKYQTIDECFCEVEMIMSQISSDIIT
jgi:hypothetical protein